MLNALCKSLWPKEARMKKSTLSLLNGSLAIALVAALSACSPHKRLNQEEPATVSSEDAAQMATEEAQNSKATTNKLITDAYEALKEAYMMMAYEEKGIDIRSSQEQVEPLSKEELEKISTLAKQKMGELLFDSFAGNSEALSPSEAAEVLVNQLNTDLAAQYQDGSSFMSAAKALENSELRLKKLSPEAQAELEKSQAQQQMNDDGQDDTTPAPESSDNNTDNSSDSGA